HEAEEPPAASVNNLELRFGLLPGYTPAHWKSTGASYYRSKIGGLTRADQFDTLRFDDGLNSFSVDQFGLVVAHRLHRVYVCPAPFVVVP
ncbi:MAG: hypothetical protein Q7R41_04565, partial [Phycisphaerales bacterium]|nr:hypothetical protein [Phycisphaerales bacterium]